MMIFAATELLPGDVCHAVLGQGATEKSLENCRERLQLDQPMHTRYLQWLGRLVTGELGTSLANDLQIADQIGARAMEYRSARGVDGADCRPSGRHIGAYCSYSGREFG